MSPPPPLRIFFSFHRVFQVFKKFYWVGVPSFEKSCTRSEYTHYSFAVADPGFPRGGANLLFGHFSWKRRKLDRGRVQNFYRPQTNLQEGNFLHLSVILLTGEGGLFLVGGLCPGRVSVQGEGVFVREVCIGGVQTPLPAPRTTGYGQEEGGTHPTGMHSCFIYFQHKVIYNDKKYFWKVFT